MKKTLVLILLLIFVIVPNLKGIKQNHNPKNYILIFDILDYDSTFRNSVKYFFTKVLKKGDSIYLVSPKKLYNLSKYSVSGISNKIIDGTIKVLKRDIEAGGVLWRETTNKRILRDIKNTYEEKILNSAKIFKNLEGDNHLVMIYQIRYTTDTGDSISNTYNSMPLNVGKQYKMKFDSDKVITVLNENKIKFHFLYLNVGQMIGTSARDATISTPSRTFITPSTAIGINTIKTNNSSDVYKVYLNIAKKSNGLSLTTKKPISFFEKLKEL